MSFRELSVPGAWEITPQVGGDSRGSFFEWFTESGFADMTGHSFDLRQANCSVSAAGVLRGLHFAQIPPSQEVQAAGLLPDWAQTQAFVAGLRTAPDIY